MTVISNNIRTIRVICIIRVLSVVIPVKMNSIVTAHVWMDATNPNMVVVVASQLRGQYD